MSKKELHDAFGKVHGLNCYHTYGPDLMNHDLGHYLGNDYRGETLDRYVRKSPQPRLPLYHLIGALDALEEKAAPVAGQIKTLPSKSRVAVCPVRGVIMLPVAVNVPGDCATAMEA